MQIISGFISVENLRLLKSCLEALFGFSSLPQDGFHNKSKRLVGGY